MSHDRRTFLKSAGVAVSAGMLGSGAALAAGTSPGTPPAATEMPTGMTFVTIRRGADLSLGISTVEKLGELKFTLA